VSNDFYNFNTVRDQIVLAQKSGLCTFDVLPLDEKRKTTIKEDWTTDCKTYPCTSGWCLVNLDIKIKGYRTRTVTIIYRRDYTMAYVWLYGTVFEELINHHILNLDSSDKRKLDERFLNTIQSPS